MKTIKLYGELGKKFGRVFRLQVRSTSEAIRALSANLPGFEECLVTAESRGVGYKIKVGDDYLDSVEHIGFPVSGNIKIIPAVFGANAEARILVGALIIAAAVVAAPFTGGTSTFAVSVGASLILGGVAQMLSPPPKSPGPKEDPNNQPSYTFAGAVNTSAQGQCVPICFGQMLVGSAIVSAGITVAQVKSGYKEKTRVATIVLNQQQIGLNPSLVPKNPLSKELYQIIETDLGPPFGVVKLKYWKYTYTEIYLVEA